MTDLINPMLDEDDDDDDYPVKSPTASQSAFRIQRPGAPAADKAAAPVGEKKAPRFGEKGYRKGIPNPHKGTPRLRVTEATVPHLVEVAKFPGSTVEAVRAIALTQPTKTGYEGGKLRTVGGTLKQLEKFEKLGLVESYTPDGDNPVTYWGATEAGCAVAQNFGYLSEPNEGTANALDDLSLERLNHYRFIGLVAAHYASPETALRDELNVPRVSFKQLVSEPQLRADFAETEWSLKDAAKEGKPSHWGPQREAMLKQAVGLVNSGVLEWNDLIEAFPLLRIIGTPGVKVGEGRKAASYHIPDLVIHLDGDRTDRRAKNIAGEIELSKKSWDGYASLFRMWAYEAKHRYVYDQVVYWTDRNDIANLIVKVDKKEGTGLIESGFLAISPLRHLDGEIVKIRRRTRD